MNDPPSPTPRSGLPAALGAYVIWGFLPLYLILVRSVPPVEFVAWRVIWTLPFCLLIAVFRRQIGEILAALHNPKAIGLLLVSALLIGVNWLIYIWAIQANHVFAASLGYYINPLINVLLGTAFLGERLSKLGWIAVGLAAAGCAVLLGGALSTLWISLSLAVSFALYGLVRKRIAVGSLPGLTIESAILLLPAGAIAVWYAQGPGGSSFGESDWMTFLIVMGGVATALPLLLFAVAARRMDYSTLGFVQFLSPTIVFVLGLTVFDLPLEPAQAICFVLIWAAIAVFVWDMWRRRSGPKPVAT